jgi:flagellar hook-associated protein 1 FlgK
MSLFGSIQMGGNTLQAMQIGLHVVGNNIANANTPGYVRQEAIYVPGPLQQHGRLILGTGVLVDSIVQKLDDFLQERLVGARGDRANAEVQEQVYGELEVMLSALEEEIDLDSKFADFFNAIDEVMNNPGSIGPRHAAVGLGEELATAFGEIHRRVFAIQGELNERVVAMADEINAQAEEIRRLNLQISSIEGGDASGSQAAGLRVQRQAAVERLSEIVNIRVDEQASGGLSVQVNGEFLVFEGQRREVGLTTTNENGTGLGSIKFVDIDSPIITAGGELQGLYTARDDIVGSFLSRIDGVAGTLAFEFNKIYSQGQGLVGFRSLTSAETINDPDAALDEGGLDFTPVSGKFEVVVTNKTNPLLTKTTTIQIELNGLDEDTTFASLASQLDSIEGLAATITPTGGLQLSSESDDVEFSFAGDTSGALAALGINTFFTGSSAASLGVNSAIRGIENASKFAASLNGVGNGSDNAARLAVLFDKPLDSAGNASLSDLYDQLINEVTQGAAVAKSVAEGYRVFEGTLDAQAQAVSGVSIDEEAVRMITLQRIYQASAKFIQTCSELLDLLVNI